MMLFVNLCNSNLHNNLRLKQHILHHKLLLAAKKALNKLKMVRNFLKHLLLRENNKILDLKNPHS